MLDHYLRGAYYPVGGGQMLAATLVEVIEAHGGTVRTRCPARRIILGEDRRVGGVVLGDGELVRAPVVVSNVDYRQTVLRLCQGQGFSPTVVARAGQSRMRAAVAVAYVALDRPLDLPNANIWWWGREDIEQAYAQVLSGAGDEVPFAFLSFASLKDPGNGALCPPGHSNFQVMTLVPPVADPDPTGYRRAPGYLAGKGRLADRLLDIAEQAVGPVRGSITHLETATARTNHRYILGGSGTPYGLADWGGTGRRPDVRTGVGGLYVVGQNTRYGAGVLGCAIGGVIAAGHILDRRLLPEIHAGAVLGDRDLLPERDADFDPLRVSRGRARHQARGLALVDRL